MAVYSAVRKKKVSCVQRRMGNVLGNLPSRGMGNVVWEHFKAILLGTITFRSKMAIVLIGLKNALGAFSTRLLRNGTV